MHRCLVACASSTILALALGCCMSLALSGCGGGEDAKEVTVTKPTQEAGKDSMEFFKKNKTQQKGQQKR